MLNQVQHGTNCFQVLEINSHTITCKYLICELRTPDSELFVDSEAIACFTVLAQIETIEFVFVADP
jgi:hypothetical protein